MSYHTKPYPFRDKEVRKRKPYPYVGPQPERDYATYTREKRRALQLMERLEDIADTLLSTDTPEATSALETVNARIAHETLRLEVLEALMKEAAKACIEARKKRYREGDVVSFDPNPPDRTSLSKFSNNTKRGLNRGTF